MVNIVYNDPFVSPERFADYEYRLALDCSIPLLKRWNVTFRGTRVLDLGCGCGGLAIALAENGAQCLGVDRNEDFISIASKMADLHHATVLFKAADIIKTIQHEESFNLIVVSEVLEHLHNLSNVKKVLMTARDNLAPEGVIYVSFPPWFSPFAGHQAGWPVIRFLPWFHLIPDKLKKILLPKHAPPYIDFTSELNHLTIKNFEQIVKQTELRIIRKEFFHLRPEYSFRYRVPVWRSRFLKRLPIVRELTTMGAFYLLVDNETEAVDFLE